MTYRIGIDAGSKTIKVVVLDEDASILASVYRRHRADIKSTLKDIMHELAWRYGDLEGDVAVTGSAGIEIAASLDLPFIQEVVATTHAVQNDLPEADVFIELGGEDAKIVYLSGGLEQRMNATCAGGTGGFIDTIAFMLGVSSKKMSSLALGARKTYPIASRCAVFAQTDVRPLLNAGANKADIAASVLDAVVKQTIGGLACGRPIEGTVVFLGGPLEHIPDLVYRFRKALGLTHNTGIKPPLAHLFTAKGAALVSDNPDRLNRPSVRSSFLRLEELLGHTVAVRDDLPRLPALFEDEEAYISFRERHGQASLERASLQDARGSLFLGIDAGSTAIKLVLVDEDRRLLYSDYQPVRGNLLDISSKMLLRLYKAIPCDYYGNPYSHIEHATVTGYGESLLMAAFRVDSGLVETTAHLHGARAFCPEVSFILDIGGQDMKALWVESGSINDAILNEACSSGCGAFVEGSAYSLKCTPHSFVDLAIRAGSPVDLGTRCTVFMNSRVRHAQKIGVSYGDIAAGIAYSVVNNALFKVIGLHNVDSLGDHVVVQGGTFLSDAVLGAFEKVLGKNVIRPDTAHLMGAYGAACVAASRADGRGSCILNATSIESMKPRYRSAICPGCTNECSLSILDFEGQESEDSDTESDKMPSFIDGNRCDRAYDHFPYTQGRHRSSRGRKKAPNIVALAQKLLLGFKSTNKEASLTSSNRKNIIVGLPCTLNEHLMLPFWHTLMNEIGFSTIVGHEVKSLGGGLETIPSESVCYSAKLSHSRISSLINQGATVIFMPEYRRHSHCPVTSLYGRALHDSIPELRNGSVQFIHPKLAYMKYIKMIEDEESLDALFASLSSLTQHVLPLSRQEFDGAIKRALSEQDSFYETLEHAGAKTREWIQREGAHGIIFGGRPYHLDIALSHGIDELISSLGFAVLLPESIQRSPSPLAKKAGEEIMSPSREKEPSSELSYRKAEWRQAKRIRRLTNIVLDDDRLDLVFLQSFGCSYDAVSLIEAEQNLKAHARPFTVLKIDEINDTAHILIRLRTLADTIEERHKTGSVKEDRGDPELLEFDAIPKMRSHTLPHGKTEMRGSIHEKPRTSRVKAVSLGPIEAKDIEVGRREISQDICSTVAAIAGRVINLCRADKEIGTINISETCSQCLFDALPELLAEPLGFCPELILENSWPETPRTSKTPRKNLRKALGAQNQSLAQDNKSRIGVLGNPYMVFMPSMNDELVSFLESMGCDVILPEAELLFEDDVRYLKQLSLFEKEKVDQIIYVQSFGCLKGHIQSRGALHDLKNRFPHAPITVIDYDPDASALNRINRLLLVVEAAKKDT